MFSDPSPPTLLIAASMHRSGSTLLQRYVTASTETFVWGENGFLVQSLRRAHESWPQRTHDARGYDRVMVDPTVVERAFMPNLSPPLDRVTEAVRGAVIRIYGELPAGFTAWGWKDVGYGRGDIDFVRELFPDLDVVLLVRNPWCVARSIRRKGWIDRRGYFEGMEEVARTWAERTAHYRELASVDDPNVLLLRYEHLDRQIVELNRFLGAAAGGDVWERISKRRLGTAPRLSRFDLTAEDVETITSIAGDVASELGYEPPAV